MRTEPPVSLPDGDNALPIGGPAQRILRARGLTCALATDRDEGSAAFARRIGDPRQRLLYQRPAGGLAAVEIGR